MTSNNATLSELTTRLTVLHKPFGLSAMYRTAVSLTSGYRDIEDMQDAWDEIWTALATAEDHQPGITYLVAGRDGSYPLLDTDDATVGARDTGERVEVTEDMLRDWIAQAVSQAETAIRVAKGE